MQPNEVENSCTFSVFRLKEWWDNYSEWFVFIAYWQNEQKRNNELAL